MTLPAWIILAYCAWRLFADLCRLLLGSSWRAGQYLAWLLGDVILLGLLIWTIASFAPSAPQHPARAAPVMQAAAEG